MRLPRHSNFGPILYTPFQRYCKFLCSWPPPLLHLNFGGVPVGPDRRCWGSMWAGTLSYSAVKLFLKCSKLCENHGTRTSQTDRQTTCYGITALCVVSHGKNRSCENVIVRSPDTRINRFISKYFIDSLSISAEKITESMSKNFSDTTDNKKELSLICLFVVSFSLVFYKIRRSLCDSFISLRCRLAKQSKQIKRWLITRHWPYRCSSRYASERHCSCDMVATYLWLRRLPTAVPYKLQSQRPANLSNCTRLGIA